MREILLFELPPVVSISSREAAEMAGCSHLFIMKRIDEHVKQLSRNNFRSDELFTLSSYRNSHGRSNRCYLMSKGACEMIACALPLNKAHMFRKKFENKFAEIATYNMPNTPVYLKKVKQPDKPSSGVLLSGSPDVLNAISTTPRSSILINMLAKLATQNGVRVGQNRLFEWLREKGYLMSRKNADYNMPTQSSMEMGLFSILERTVHVAGGHIKIVRTPKVTWKGQMYLLNKIIESAGDFK